MPHPFVFHLYTYFEVYSYTLMKGSSKPYRVARLLLSYCGGDGVLRRQKQTNVVCQPLCKNAQPERAATLPILF